MKACNECYRVVLDKDETCPECGGTKFTPLLVPFYDDIGPCLDEDDEQNDHD